MLIKVMFSEKDREDLISRAAKANALPVAAWARMVILRAAGEQDALLSRRSDEQTKRNTRDARIEAKKPKPNIFDASNLLVTHAQLNWWKDGRVVVHDGVTYSSPLEWPYGFAPGHNPRDANARSQNNYPQDA